MFIVKNIHDVARFLKEVKGMNFEEIAKIVKRPIRDVTSWAMDENWGSNVYHNHTNTYLY